MSKRRSRTIALYRVTRLESKVLALLYPEKVTGRPRTRAECINGQRPCPYVSCRYHLYLDVDPKGGSVRMNFPATEVWDLEHSCSLDLADGGGMTLDRVGEAMNVTRERARQIIEVASQRLRHQCELQGIDAGELSSSDGHPSESEESQEHEVTRDSRAHIDEPAPERQWQWLTKMLGLSEEESLEYERAKQGNVQPQSHLRAWSSTPGQPRRLHLHVVQDAQDEDDIDYEPPEDKIFE